MMVGWKQTPHPQARSWQCPSSAAAADLIPTPQIRAERAQKKLLSGLLWILPKLPITLGGNIVYIYAMVVQDPLYFNLLLGRDYVYFMGVIVSSLFCMMCFPHDGRIMTIDRLSFIGPNLAPNQLTSLNGSYMQVVSSLP